MKLLSKEKLDEVVEATKLGGATLTKLIGTSAWYAPGAAAAFMAEAILKDKKLIRACAVLLEGEYDEHDLVIGVPVVIGKNGWEKVVDFPITDKERAAFKASAEATRQVNQILYETGML